MSDFAYNGDKFTCLDKSPGTEVGKFILVNGDCLDYLGNVLEPASVDCVITSPPYNLGFYYGELYDDSQPREDYLVWLSNWLDLTMRALKQDGHLFLNLAGSAQDPMMPFQFIARLDKRYKLQNVIHWIKSISEPTTEDPFGPVESTGQFRPVNSDRFLFRSVEYVFNITHTGNSKLDKLAVGVEYQDKSNIKRWKSGSSGVRDRGNVIVIPYETITSKEKDRPFPCPFPKDLPLYCMRLAGLTEDSICMDPFMGAGSSGMAALEVGCNFIGIELVPEWYTYSINRILDNEGVCTKQV